MLFFFSSRRRHTRWPRDWSSDVCSSDLFHFSRAGVRCHRRVSHFEQVSQLFLKTGLADAVKLKIASIQRFVQPVSRSEEQTSELKSRGHIVCRLLLVDINRHHSMITI